MRAKIADLRRSLTLSGVFFVYFTRKVFSYRLGLSSRMFILGICVLLYGTVLIYRLSLLAPVFYDFVTLIGAAESIINLFMAFLFAKILFLRSGGLMNFTMQLPLKNKERTMALTICEILIVFMGFTILYSPEAIVSTWKTGQPAYLLVNGLMPGFIAYILCSLIYNLSVRIFILFNLSRLSHIGGIIVTIFAFLGLLIFVGQSVQSLLPAPGQSIKQAYDHLQTDVFLIFNVFFWLFQHYGLLTSILAFLISLIILFPALIISIPSKYPDVHRFIKFPVPFINSTLWPFIAVFIRRIEWWVAVVVSILSIPLGGFVLILLNLHLLALFSAGIYMFSMSRAIRLLPGYRLSATRETLYMFAAQALCICPFLMLVQLALYIASFASGTIVPHDPINLSVILMFGVILPTFIGILFVHNEDNPVQAFAGYFVVSIIAMVTYLAISVTGQIFLLILFTEAIVAIPLTILAVQAVRKSERYA